MTRPVVDVHTHTYTPYYVEYLRSRADAPRMVERDGLLRFELFPGDIGVEVTDEFTTPEGKLAFMDRVGIQHSVVSLGNPWMDVLPPQESPAAAHEVNTELASFAGHGSGRLSCMGVLPTSSLEDVVSAVEEVERLGLRGVMSGPQICGRAFDDPALGPVWECLASLGVPIFVHPRSGVGGADLRGFGQVLTLALSFPVETTNALARLVLGRVLDRHPGLRVIGAHGAGVLPFLGGRLARAAEVDPAVTELGGMTSIYADTILFSEAALRLCVDTIGSDRLMFGTDHPFPIADAEDGLRMLRGAAGGSPEVESRMSWRNAAELFGVGVGGEEPGDR